MQITARDFALSEALEAEIRERAAKLEVYYDRIMRCRVSVEAHVGHHHRGGPYKVRIDLTVPGAELVVNRQDDADLLAAVRDAFDAMRRRLEDYVRRLRGAVKVHEEPLLQGQVTKLFPHEGYGFIETADGREVYFHRHSVLEPGFDHIELGAAVRFAEEEGHEGPQASTVHIVKTHTKAKT